VHYIRCVRHQRHAAKGRKTRRFVDIVELGTILAAIAPIKRARPDRITARHADKERNTPLRFWLILKEGLTP